MKLYFLLLVLVSFFVLGCGGSRKITSISNQEKKDSIFYREVVKVDTIKIPFSNVQLGFDNKELGIKSKDIEVLNNQFLLQKAKTGSKANVQFRVVKDSIYIEGTCDSSELLSLRKTIDQYRSSNNTTQKFEKEIKTRGFSFFDIIIVGITAFGMGISISKLLNSFGIL